MSSRFTSPPCVQRRQLLLASLGVALLCVPSPVLAAAARQSTTVLFVCRFGTVKSAVAREAFRSRARERGILVEAVSRGVTPADHLSPELRQRLQADGLDPRVESTEPLSMENLKAADIVVIFDALPSGLHHSGIRDWRDLPSMNDDYARSRDTLMHRIDNLLDELTDSK